MSQEELLNKYRHYPDEFPVLKEQTHKIIDNKQPKTEKININDNLMHYVQDTALLISVIDGSLKNESPFDHIIYLDKSARPVSWLVNMLWNVFAAKDSTGNIIKRPPHTYVNIDRSPWFRNVGISVSDDGRKKDNGELARYTDFLEAAKAGKLLPAHIAPLRALFIEGGIDTENADEIMNTPTILDGKRVLIVDEVSRTGSTLSIAEYLFEQAVPDAARIIGDYFWHPQEPAIMVNGESVLTSLPVWYDPNTLTGRGIGGLEPDYFKQRYGNYLLDTVHRIDYKKLHTQAFSASVYSAPLLDEEGNVITLDKEKVTRLLTTDLVNMVNEYKAGRIFFEPPMQWRMSDTKYDECLSFLQKQGVLVITDDDFDVMSPEEIERRKKSPLFYMNFAALLRKS